MGVRHLVTLREYLKKNKNKSFSATELRNELNQNYPQILDNLNYLMNQEGLVEQTGKKYQWKNR